MIEANLIKSCVCGNELFFEKSITNGLDVLSCKSCGIMHQELQGWTSNDYIDFYKHQYHKDYQAKKGVISYHDRYEHDCRVADMRLDAYKKYLYFGMTGLDIGSSNSAFVHRARARGFACLGLEPGEDIGDKSVTIKGTLDNTYLNPEHFDFVTMHDSIEHMIDVKTALEKVNSIIKLGGYLILDLPDYFIEAGKHHWKYIEHLWLFNQTDMKTLLVKHGFDVLDIVAPIPGKLVFYARKIKK